jgi:hypothetical protein
MPRARLPDRRPSLTLPVTYQTASGKALRVLVTFGFDEHRHIREIFTADFKAGSDNNALMSDACVLLSLQLQHGYRPQELADRLCDPPSLLGTILRLAATIDVTTESVTVSK